MSYRQFKRMSPRQIRDGEPDDHSPRPDQPLGGLDTGSKPEPPAATADQPVIPPEPGRIRASLEHLDGTVFAELPCNESAGKIVIGRGNSAAISLVDPHIHRVHAYLTWNPRERVHAIAHAGGENTTYVNRQKVETQISLSSGARIRMGKSEFIYRLH